LKVHEYNIIDNQRLTFYLGMSCRDRYRISAVQRAPNPRWTASARFFLAFSVGHAIMLAHNPMPTSGYARMQTIALISQKGGTGKTTLALNLAVASEVSGLATALIDLDPQASAKEWSKSRARETPVVISVHASQLEEVLNAAKENGAVLSIIDTAPHSERDALAAARLADLILIPCRPAILDLRAMASTKDLADLARTPALAVVNAAPPRGHLPDEAAEAIRGYGLEVASVVIAHRAAFVHALTVGQTVIEFEPRGKAAEEINALFKIACKHANMPATEKTRRQA
jgi:chromosome partitioning protein